MRPAALAAVDEPDEPDDEPDEPDDEPDDAADSPDERHADTHATSTQDCAKARVCRRIYFFSMFLNGDLPVSFVKT
jgi:hypothetical protein